MSLAIAIWRSDIFRPGGWPEVGAPLLLLGAIETLFLPRLLARRWRSPDG